MGIILFYIIFIILIPIYLIYSDNTDAFNYYFPAIVMLAIVITEAGKPNDNQNLYPIPAENLQGFVSTNIINGLAIAAILYQAVAAAGLPWFSTAVPLQACDHRDRSPLCLSSSGRLVLSWR